MTQPVPQDPQKFESYQPAGMTCPKCRGEMRTFDRNGVHIDQCLNCRGVFLDFGELEHLTQLETRFAAPPVVQPGYPQQGYGQPGYGFGGPEWGNRGGHHYRKRGIGSLFFSS